MKSLTIDTENIPLITKPQQENTISLDASDNATKTIFSLLELELAFAQYKGIFESLEEVLEEMW